MALFGFTLSYDEFPRTALLTGSGNTLPVEMVAVSSVAPRPNLYAVGTLTTIFSLGVWSGFYPLDFIPAFSGRNIYDATDFLAVNTLLPVGGLLISLFFGWWVPRNINLESIGISDTVAFRFWRFLVRYFIPPILLVVLIAGLRG